MAWTTYLKPADINLSFEDAGIQEQTGEQLGIQWITPDGHVYAATDGHKAFADTDLGGEEAAYNAGCVRVHFDAGALNMQARDAVAFDQAALELMARNGSVQVIAAESYPTGKYASFTPAALEESYDTLSMHIAKAWHRARYGRLHYIIASEDKSKVIEEPLTVDHLTITFHDKLFDYYLGVPNMDPGWYITEIGGMKVGFGSKYQLKKFLLKLKTEFFTDGNLPGSNIKIAPIPEIEEPLVRRMGSVPVIEHGMPPEVKKALEQGAVGPQVWEISEGNEDSNKTLNSRPTGPML